MSEKPKIGEGHLSAMGRLGLREARELGNPGGNVVQQSEYGLYGTRTPGEVAEARRADDREMSEESSPGSVVSDRMREIEQETNVHGDRGADREREMEMDR